MTNSEKKQKNKQKSTLSTLQKSKPEGVSDLKI